MKGIGKCNLKLPLFTLLSCSILVGIFQSREDKTPTGEYRTKLKQSVFKSSSSKQAAFSFEEKKLALVDENLHEAVRHKTSVARREKGKGHLFREHQMQETGFQNVTPSGDLIAYSAYYDTATASKKKVVHVMMLYGNVCFGWECPVTAKVICILWFDKRMQNFEVVNEVEFNIVPDHHYKRYKPVILTCVLPDDRKPVYVSIVDTRQPDSPPTNHIFVSYNTLNRHEKRTFTMCLSPLYGSPASVEDLVKYFELNIILGAQHFIVYNYSLTNEKCNSVLAYYKKLGIIEIIQWKLPTFVNTNDGVWYKAQLTMLNDCIYRNKGVSEFVIISDLDEFIIPLKKSKWMELLSDAPPSCVYLARSVVMRQNSSQKTRVDYDKQSRDNGLTFLRNRERTRRIFPYGIRSKYIVRPKCVKIAGVHDIAELFVSKHIAPRYLVPINEALVYHYADSSRLFATVGSSYFDNTLSKYALPLIKQLKSVLHNINLQVRLN